VEDLRLAPQIFPKSEITASDTRRVKAESRQKRNICAISLLTRCNVVKLKSVPGPSFLRLQGKGNKKEDEKKGKTRKTKRIEFKIS
jgi:hypothetical protein